MSDKKLLFKASLFASVCGILITVSLMCIFACIMLTTGVLPQLIVNYAVIAILCMGAFCGGLIASRITKSAGLIAGLITGLIIFLLIVILGMIKSSESITVFTLLKFIFTAIGGSVGGIIGVNRKEKIHIK